jgi:hypothetical protein
VGLTDGVDDLFIAFRLNPGSFGTGRIPGQIYLTPGTVRIIKSVVPVSGFTTVSLISE